VVRRSRGNWGKRTLDLLPRGTPDGVLWVSSYRGIPNFWRLRNFTWIACPRISLDISSPPFPALMKSKTGPDVCFVFSDISFASMSAFTCLAFPNLLLSSRSPRMCSTSYERPPLPAPFMNFGLRYFQSASVLTLTRVCICDISPYTSHVLVRGPHL
jgi:hypothetical protein